MLRVRRQHLASPLVGLTTGVLAGANGNISMPAIAYLQQLDLPRNDIDQLLGILFGLGALTLGLALRSHGDYEHELLLISTLAVIPGVLGMCVGQHIRGKLSEAGFRRALFLGLLVVGVHLLWKGTR